MAKSMDMQSLDQKHDVDPRDARPKSARKLLRPDVEPLLTVCQSAAMAGVGESTFWRWLADPHLTLRDVVVRLPGGRPRLPAWKLREWIEKNGRKS